MSLYRIARNLLIFVAAAMLSYWIGGYRAEFGSWIGIVAGIVAPSLYDRDLLTQLRSAQRSLTVLHHPRPLSRRVTAWRRHRIRDGRA